MHELPHLTVFAKVRRRDFSDLASAFLAGKLIRTPSLDQAQPSENPGTKCQLAILMSTLTRAEIAEILNQRGILTGHGKPWDKSRIRLPLERARALIADDQKKATDAHYANNPSFGLF